MAVTTIVFATMACRYRYVEHSPQEAEEGEEEEEEEEGGQSKSAATGDVTELGDVNCDVPSRRSNGEENKVFDDTQL